MSIPPMVSFLGSGLPNLNLIESVLADVDNRLVENGHQIESCLSDLLKQSTRLNGGKSFSTPKDALQYMTDHHILEKTSCYDPDLDEVMKFLKHIIHTLDDTPGCEDVVLKDLLSFSEQSGVSLPSYSHNKGDVHDSMVSLHTVTDTGELAVTQLWEKVVLRLKKSLIERLSKLPLNQNSPEIDINGKKRLEYVQSLCSLLPVEDVWEKYRNVRIQQLGKCFATLLSEGGNDEVDIIDAGNNCEELTAMIITMLNEDFILLNTGVFKRATTTLHALHDIYLDKFTDEMSALVDEIQDEMACNARKGNQSMPHSHSEMGLQGSPAHLLKRAGKTKSLDSMSMLSVEQIPHTNLAKPALSPHYLRVILKVVKGFIHIDNHMEELHNTMSWEVGGANNKKTRSKGSIRGVLKASPSPDLMRRPMSAMSYESALSDTSTPSLDTSLSSTMSGAFKTPKVVEKTQVEDRPNWDWSHMFKKLSPELSQCVDYLIQQSRYTSLNSDQASLKEGHHLETAAIDPELVGGRLDYPRVVFKSCDNFLSVLDLLLPLAIAGSDHVFQTTRASFVDTSSVGLKDFHMFLSKLSADVPKKHSVKVLYEILSTAAYIRNHILHYENILSGDNPTKKLFTTIYKQYVELVETLTSQICLVHTRLLTESLLFDPESQNWEDSKEFYENERCSYPVQMWNHHLQMLCEDLWSICPPRLSQQILSSVLQESLDSLGRCYCRVKPSYRRTPQFRVDVTTILLCVSELLYPSCNSVSKYLDVNRSQSTHYSIHTQCCHLLAALAVIASPLEALYKIFKKGFTGRKSHWSDVDSMSEADSKGYPSHWLSWIRPRLIQDGQRHYEDLRTTSAVHIQVKLLTSQPTPHWPMIVQAVVMKDFTLSILILTSAVDRLHDRRVQPMAAFSEPLAGGQRSPEANQNSIDSPQTHDMSLANKEVKQLFDSFFYVMLRCCHFPDGIGKVILPVVNRSDEWEFLSTTAYPKGAKTPVWLESVYELMAPFINRVGKSVILEVLECQQYTPDIPPISSDLQELPCGCPIQRRQFLKSNTRTGEKDLVDWSLRELITQLSTSIELMPYPVYVLFKMLQDAACHKKVKLSRDSVGLQIIAGCLRHQLSSSSNIESVTGIPVRSSTSDTLTTIADSVYNTLTSTSSKSSSGTPRPASFFKKHNKEWLTVKIETIVDFLNSEMFEPSEGTMLDGSAQEFADQVFLSAATNILSSPQGQMNLQLIHNLLVRNRGWLDRQLDIQPLLPQSSTHPTPAFSPCVETPEKTESRPINSFNKIGEYHMNHAAIFEFPIDWYKLLQSDLGLSEVGFHTLLYNRQEMQDSAYVEDQDKKAVSAFKRKFNNELSDLN